MFSIADSSINWSFWFQLFPDIFIISWLSQLTDLVFSQFWSWRLISNGSQSNPDSFSELSTMVDWRLPGVAQVMQVRIKSFQMASQRFHFFCHNSVLTLKYCSALKCFWLYLGAFLIIMLMMFVFAKFISVWNRLNLSHPSFQSLDVPPPSVPE